VRTSTAAATIIVSLLHPAALCAQVPTCNLDSALRVMEEAYAQVNDYTCTLSKKEYIDGEYVVWNNVMYKFRKPDCYYMKWTEGKSSGQEVIYARRKYGNELKVHLGGFMNLMNFSLDPEGSIAMRSSRHPITESDFGSTLRLIQKNVRRAGREKSATIECLDEATVNGRKTRHYRAVFPEKKGFINHVISMYVDTGLNFPIKIEMYDWNDRLVESYTFADLKINVGLKDIDFDTENTAYEY
jgi:outer membrane lipoprotein-sorting protein